jgi:hypothetical protein
MSMLTRRELCRIVGPILGLAMATKKLRGTAASRLHIDSLLAGSDLALPTPVVRAYRADAVIALLGVPIFAREAVGSAFAVVRETLEGDQKIIALQFCRWIGSGKKSRLPVRRIHGRGGFRARLKPGGGIFRFRDIREQ